MDGGSSFDGLDGLDGAPAVIRPGACCPRTAEGRGDGYRPRNPEQSVLYRAVAGNLETFLARQRDCGRSVPQFLEREFRAFLECGVPACGFLRLFCDSCGRDKLLPLSCKGCAVCPSCCGRRMADTAAHLVDRVFPEVPVRQWVLSFPFALRYRLAYDAHLLTDVLGVFIIASQGICKVKGSRFTAKCIMVRR